MITTGTSFRVCYGAHVDLLFLNIMSCQSFLSTVG